MAAFVAVGVIPMVLAMLEIFAFSEVRQLQGMTTADGFLFDFILMVVMAGTSFYFIQRSMARPVAEQLADGRVYTGRQAVTNGLVDEIGGEQQALAWLDSQRGVSPALPLYDLEVDETENVVERLVSSVGGAILPRRLMLDGLLAVWHPGLGRE